MRIAVDCRMCGKSGIGMFIDGLLPHFACSGHEILLICRSGCVKEFPGSETVICDIPLFSVKETFLFPWPYAEKINSCDVYFTPYCSVPSGLRIPIVTTIHDIVFLDMPDLAGKIGTAARKMFYRRAVRKSAAVLTVSEFSRSRIEEKLGCSKPVHVVYSSVPEIFRSPRPSGLKKTDTVIFIGNIKRHKGLATLLDAFRIFREKTEGGCSPRLIVVGARDNFRTDDGSISAMTDGDSGVEFTGYIDDMRLRTLLAEARLLVQPSLYEGFGLPPLQALYSGTKAVISDIPVFTEIYAGFPVTFFRTGDAYDLASKMETVWNDGSCLPGIPERYSFERTFSLVMDVISGVSAQ